MPSKIEHIFSEEDCSKWRRNPQKNPKTNRGINPTAKSGVYSMLLKQCSHNKEDKQKTPKSPKEKDAPFTAKECERWKQEPAKNPRTNRRINVDSKYGVFKKLQQQCTERPVLKIESRTVQQKYCDCLMHVRPKRVPYGICTKSVLHRKNASPVAHPKFCEYTFENYPVEELAAYARELNLRKKHPLGAKSPLKMSHTDLVKSLAAYVKLRKGQ